ncbi:MAG: hypothetical protein V1702_02105 [Candidatus Woesearchaeota archaeon]
MVKGIPDWLSKESYHKLSGQQRVDHWVKLVSEKLRIPESEALQLIERNNAQPFWEINDGKDSRAYLDPGEHHTAEAVKNRKIYPRFNANAILLARLSADDRGPLGPRPIFVSLENIVRISLGESEKTLPWRNSLGGGWKPFGAKLVDLQLSASNPDNAPKGVGFSDDDIRKGVYIPPRMSKPVARALGITYSDGYICRTSLSLAGSQNKSQFYAEVVTPVFEEAFNLYSEYAERKPRSGFSENKCGAIRLFYSSKALVSYLVNYLGFGCSEEERRVKGLSTRITDKSFAEYLPDFLKSYLASASRFSTANALTICIPEVSKRLLEDVGQLLEDILEKPTVNIRQVSNARSYKLSIGAVSTLELFFRGFLNENPRLRAELEAYLSECGIGQRAFKHLHPLFGDEIVQYRRERKNAGTGIRALVGTSPSL